MARNQRCCNFLVVEVMVSYRNMSVAFEIFSLLNHVVHQLCWSADALLCQKTALKRKKRNKWMLLTSSLCLVFDMMRYFPMPYVGDEKSFYSHSWTAKSAILDELMWNRVWYRLWMGLMTRLDSFHQSEIIPKHFSPFMPTKTRFFPCFGFCSWLPLLYILESLSLCIPNFLFLTSK